MCSLPYVISVIKLMSTRQAGRVVSLCVRNVHELDKMQRMNDQEYRSSCARDPGFKSEPGSGWWTDQQGGSWPLASTFLDFVLPLDAVKCVKDPTDL